MDTFCCNAYNPHLIMNPMLGLEQFETNNISNANYCKTNEGFIG
jgi:hypothetical protein